MDKLSLLDVVNKYIDDEKKRNDEIRSKSAIYKWIIDDVRDMLVAINEDYREIDNDDANAKKIFRNTIVAQFETVHFRNFLKNKSKTNTTHYQNLLNACLINSDTIKDFLDLENESNSNLKTLDFFKAFCKYQEKEYGEGVSNIATKEQRKQPIRYVDTGKLEIPGARIIDEEFIEGIKTQSFSMYEFYTAMYDDDCQWFGVTKGWDVIRKHFEEIKNKVKNVFESRKTLKVSFVVHGNGGAGKTCFLRRLAKELHKEESFSILWLNSKIDNFLDQGLKVIEEKQDTKFLIFIEDWGKLLGYKNSVMINRFLEQTNNIQNVRIIIGDRNINNDYSNYLNNDIEPLLLSAEENRDIIKKIVENITEWQEVSEKLFEIKKIIILHYFFYFL